ncbi:serine/threonine protein kinase [Bradymonadaceae bacterium TMQ3]|uniref:Serine/threonine protein kinase n=1 Tax=Lujinxingia sediminis TaxID=2480984 RepID=A0ABY0CTU1_9DELT|nr:serine/threonine-protein kinase [Lujinxingia sediminis]RDV38698.1 serine/threonine protein kinase [Bradymonadaceae bacterium TMQ3]RVU44749.1 serine/threonine protein kinase [Lujinxingia sediminis]TXC76529.1 serine/threonine protein kinase [Bradymonadales bacterium TMQ1]
MASTNEHDPTSSPREKVCWQCGRTFSTALEMCPDDGARLIETGLEDLEDPLIGSIFDGRFQIYKKLGEGGMGAVYSARRLDFETDVALKLLKVDFARDEGIRKRFMYEARVISNLKHPHAVRLFDFGQTSDGHFYMVMELLHGESLADRLAYRFVTYREVFDIIPPICGVLGEAHAQDVIHRDLKPENIYLLKVEENHEFPKLLDFGIAKHNRAETMTQSGTLWGTPAYMSPEQARGDVVGAAADIYGIGIMVYELISGNLPFHASTQMGFAVKHLNEPARPLSSIPGLNSVPAALDELVLSMLAKRPEDRPGSMEEVVARLEVIRAQDFSPELLARVPAEEVDPIALQAWMRDAPDISQNQDARASSEASSSQEGRAREIDAFGQTDVANALPAFPLSSARDVLDTLPAPGTSAMASSSVSEDVRVEREAASASAEFSAVLDAAPVREERRRTVMVVGAGAVLVVLMIAALMFGGDTLNGLTPADQAAADVEAPQLPTTPLDMGNVVSAAAMHGAYVSFEARELARHLAEAERLGQLQDFEFVNEEVEASEEGSGKERETTPAVDDRTLRKALESTF